jgi:hypothetical protein
MALQINQRAVSIFRMTSGAFALVAFAASLWLFAADALATRSDTVEHAARVGVVRGDLWALAAHVGARALPVPPAEPASEQRQTADAVRDLATRAASYSPTNARIWLLLARVAVDPAQRVEFLKMSYLTGQNDLYLAPQRLTLATRLPSSDPMLADFTALEIQTLPRRAPNFIGATITSAYKTANADGKALIEKTLEAFDPSLLSKIRAAQ